jgi:hypothetical protein
MIAPIIQDTETRKVTLHTSTAEVEDQSILHVSAILVFALPIICALGFFLTIASLFKFWEKRKVKKLYQHDFYKSTLKVESITEHTWHPPSIEAPNPPSSASSSAARSLLPFFGLEENAPLEQIQLLVNTILKKHGKDLNTTLRERFLTNMPKTTAEIVANSDHLYTFLRATNDFFFVLSLRKPETCPVSQEQIQAAELKIKTTQTLEICDAPCLPSKILRLTELKALRIEKTPCQLLINEILRKNRSLTKLSICNCKDLTSLSKEHCQAVKELRIEHCPLLAKLPAPMNNLRELELNGLTSLQNAPDIFRHFPQLVSLHLANDQMLTTLPDMSQLESLQTLIIENIKKFHELPALPPFISSLQIKNCPNFSCPNKLRELTLSIKEDASHILYYEYS